jgi:hypothetical protein
LKPTFTASAQSELPASPDFIFDVATSPALLSAWVPFLQHVRLDDNTTKFHLGSTFHANESFADNPTERDQRFQVTDWTPGRTFRFERSDEAGFEGRLLIQAGTEGSNVTWTTSGPTPAGAERVLAAIMRASVQKQANRQAERQLQKLADLIERASENHAT